MRTPSLRCQNRNEDLSSSAIQSLLPVFLPFKMAAYPPLLVVSGLQARTGATISCTWEASASARTFLACSKRLAGWLAGADSSSSLSAAFQRESLRVAQEFRKTSDPVSRSPDSWT